MAKKVKFQPQKFDINSINGGNRYGLEGIQPEAVNAPIEAAAYAQALATNQPNIENAGLVGTPSVSIEEFDGTPRFKFQNLKGEKGIDGKDHSEEIAQLNEKLETYFISAKEQIDINSEEISKNSAKIHNLTGALLEGGVMGVVEVEQAYSVRQTADGEDIVDYNGEGQFTFPEKITGATVKTTNLIPYPYSQVSINNPFNSGGITFTEKSDGSISVVGTATATSYCRIGEVYLMSGEKYTLSAGAGSANAFVYVQRPISNETYSAISGTITFTAKNTATYEVYITVRNGITVNMTIYPMLNPGDTAKPFSPYFAGLKNAYFKGVKSTGKNLIPYPYEENGTASWRINTDGSVIVNVSTGENQYSMLRLLSENPFVAGNTYILSGGKSGVVLIVFYQINGVDKYFQSESGSFSRITWKEEFAFKKLYLQVNPNTTVSNATIYPMLNLDLGSTALDYEPYKSDESFMLDEAVKLGEWDSINPESGEVTRATKTIVFDGTEAWNKSGAYCWLTLTEAPKSYTAVISNNYDTAYGETNAVFCEPQYSRLSFQFADSTIWATIDDWKAHLAELYAAGKPLTVAYELATPTTETVEFPTKKYQAWNGGSETLVQGDTDNSTFGAMPTVTNEYVVVLGGEE